MTAAHLAGGAEPNPAPSSVRKGRDRIPLAAGSRWRSFGAARTVGLWAATLALVWSLSEPTPRVHPEDWGLGHAVAVKGSFVRLLAPVSSDTVVIDGHSYSTRAPGFGWTLGLLQWAGLSERAALRTLQLGGAASLLIVLTPLIGVAWAILVLLSPPLISWATIDCGAPLWVASFIVLATTTPSPWVAGFALGLIPVFDFRVMPIALLAPLSGWQACVTALPGLLAVGAYNWIATGAPWDFIIWHSQNFPWAPHQFFWFSPWEGFTAVWAHADLNDPLRHAIGEPWPGFAVVAPWVVLMPLAVRARVWWRPAPWVVLGVMILLLTHRTTIPRYLVPLIPFWIVAATQPDRIATAKLGWLTRLAVRGSPHPTTS